VFKNYSENHNESSLTKVTDTQKLAPDIDTNHIGPVSVSRHYRVFLLPLFKSNSLATLQKLIAFYLIAVIVNEISLQHFQLRILSMDLGVSWSMPVLLLFMTACIANRLGSTKKKTQPQCRHISTAWVLALVLIISHMIVLGPILHKFYGYGYRHDLPVAGNLCLYLLLFLSVWKSLDRLWLRRFTALVLALFFLAAPFV